jgi:sialate O-acetylesterase
MPTRAITQAGVLALLLTATVPTAHADPRLPAVIGDHMVLQRHQSLPIWGWADPGEAIIVRVADARGDAVTGVDGRWRVTLPPLAAGGPFQLLVHGKTTVRINDVLVGEVWLCAGQSNMRFPLGATDTAAADVPAAFWPRLRLFTVARKTALTPAEDVQGAWQVTTPETARDFSAVAYYFGRELATTLDVPIGLVHVSWSGTAGEEWLDAASLARDPDFAPILQRWHAAPEEEQAIYRRPEPVRIELDDFRWLGAGDASEPLADFDDGMARTILGGGMSFDWTSAPRVAFTLARGRDRMGWAALLSGTLDSADVALLRMPFRPWEAPVDLGRFQGLRFAIRGSGALRLRLLQPSITDWDDYATAPIAATPEWRTVTVAFHDLAQAGWGRRLPLTLDAASGIGIELLPAVRTSKRPPSGLFNGMIRPLAPFGIRGAVWYQGEGNTARAYQYRRLLPAIIGGWRAAWGQEDFPFGIVQLPGYGKSRPEPRGSRWAELREAQLMTLAVPQTGLAVTIDQGDPDDVHPRHKIEVGRRLARWALGAIYGRPVVYSGPRYESIRRESGRLRVHFGTAGSALVARNGEPLRGFAVAGANRAFHWADAQIEGDDVVAWSDAVPVPVAVRYAWADNPDATLVNRDGLPASPFRSDDWPGKTVDER